MMIRSIRARRSRTRSAVVAGGALLVAALAIPIPVAATVPRPLVVVTDSRLILDSDPGDPIGQGLVSTLDPVTMSGSGVYSNGIYLNAEGPGGWAVTFRAADGVPLAVGAYEGAVRAVSAGPGQPGLDFYGHGRGCNTVTGRFVVVDAPVFDVDGTTLLSFGADFEQHCEGQAPALYGSIRFHSDVPVKLLTLIGPADVGNELTGAPSAPHSYTVSNIGTADATPATLDLDGTNAADFTVDPGTCLGVTLAPGATCDIGLTFTPSDLGSRSARMSLTGDTDLGVRRRIVTGTGIAADATVDVTGLSVSPGTFYPYRDRYLDTTRISGVLGESAVVSIRITSVASGRAVRVVALGPRTGPYAFDWNGKSGTGHAVAAGRYRVVQTLTDGLGNVLTWSGSVTVSAKHFYRHTVTIVRNGRSAKAAGSAGGGWYSTSRSGYAGGIKVYSGAGGAAVGWSFEIPTSRIYRTLKFSVTGRSTTPRTSLIGIQDWRLGSAWFTGNFDPLKSAGTRYRTYSISVAATGHHHRRTVRGMIWVVDTGSGAVGFDVRSVKLVVVYGTLR